MTEPRVTTDDGSAPPPGLVEAVLSHESARVSGDTKALAGFLERGQATLRVDTSGLGDLQIQITDLGGSTLGLASGNTLWLDDNAAGWGWFLDPTPWDDSEFSTPGNQGERRRIDLLAVLEHEIGHLLGQDHEADGVMAEALATGVRRTANEGHLDRFRFADTVFVAFLAGEEEWAW